MGDKNNVNAILSASLVVVLLAAVGLVVYTPSPFKGIRPDVKQQYDTSGKVSARLWQDPFGAVLAAPPDAVLNSEESAARLKREVVIRSRGDKIVVLGVMVFGAPYSEQTEMRVRHRYAVLSALANDKFIPDDPEHIQYVIYKPGIKEDTPGGKINAEDIIPYEWLSNTDDTKSVLLLWMNDDRFGAKPGSRPVKNIRDALDSFGIRNKNAEIKIIGPAGSTALINMIREAKETESLPEPEMQFYSATATVEDRQLMKEAGIIKTDNRPEEVCSEQGGSAQPDCRKYLEDLLQRENIKFRRTIGTDQDLAGSLADELKRRDLINKDTAIAFVSEWDTSYGRNLPVIFQAAITQMSPAVKFYPFNYFRGIDGKLPLEEKRDEQDKKEQERTNKITSIQGMEDPTGKSQLDYLRRLADRIYGKHLQLKNEGKNGISAIGILGSDFYDKYLVLQALRQRMPEVTFFTTDLDARYLQMENLKWTRNLIVVSHFGFELKSDKNEETGLQGGAPPFRDTYQTSVFSAAMSALRNTNRYVAPSTYEIGRRHAVCLSCPREYGNKKNVLLLLCIISGLVLLPLSSYRIRELLQGRIKLFTAIGAVLIAVIILLMKVATSVNEEPFSLFEGISIWPAVILRAISAMLAIILIRNAFSCLSTNCAEIKRDYFSNNTYPIACFEPLLRKGMVFSDMLNLMKRWDIFNVRKVERADYDSSGDVTRIMNRYLDCGCCESRLLRILPVFIVYVVFVVLFMKYFGVPQTPLRGMMTLYVNRAVLLISLTGFLMLTFFVVDATRLCTFFIDTVARRTPVWPKESYESILSDYSKSAGFSGDVMPLLSDSTKAILGEWITVKLVAKRTDAVSKLIFYPIIVWLVLFLSRSNYFDNWNTPIYFALLISLPAVYAWSSAYILRRSAEQMRKAVLDRLDLRRHKAALGASQNHDNTKEIDYIIGEIKSIQTGAFLPFSQRPIVRSLLTAAGGIGGITALEFIQWLNL